MGNKELSVDELVNLITELKTGQKTQERPVVVWVDKVEGDILKYADYGDYRGLAQSFCDNDGRVVFNAQIGTSFTGHDYYIDENGDKKKITDSLRNQFFIPEVIRSNSNGDIITKIYIHSPLSCNIGEKGITSAQLGKMIKDKLGISVFMFYPLSWREKFKKHFQEYDEVICTDNIDEVKSRWLKRVAEKSENGFQIVDNFFLDFLKTAPNTLLSSDFEKREVFGCLCRYEKWEEMSRELIEKVVELFFLDKDVDREPTKEEKEFYSLFTDGNLNMENLSVFLSSIPNKLWEEWYQEHEYDFKNYPQVTINGDRIEAFKIHLATDSGYLPNEATEALLRYHGISGNSKDQ